jgi:N-hydroxyarylamine O-acetyltransferase
MIIPLTHARIGGGIVTMNLDAYLRRIGYDGPREASLRVLARLHALHPAAIPFENLDPLLGRPVSLDSDRLQSKLVFGRRGGYCFEQNSLFRWALEALGFSVTPLLARVVWMAPPERPLGGRNHMLLKVDLGADAYIADVGFGGQLVSAPLKLTPGLEQATAEAMMRLDVDGEALIVKTRLPSGWVSLYRFTLERAELSDYEVSNWYTSTHPTFFLTTNLLAERLSPAVRASLFNRRLTRRYPDGHAEVIDLTSAGDLTRALVEDMGISAPGEVAALFARLPTTVP